MGRHKLGRLHRISSSWPEATPHFWNRLTIERFSGSYTVADYDRLRVKPSHAGYNFLSGELCFSDPCLS